MITSIKEFEGAWGYESGATQKYLDALTDPSLARAVGPEDRTLGRIAWHIVTAIPEMMERTGLKLEAADKEAPPPPTAAAIAKAYAQAAGSLLAEIRKNWSDKTLGDEDEMYGERWKRGDTLSVLILHQTHHRGQMSVLMRQAGLKVPGAYGPAREEWTGMGAQSPAV